MNTEFHELWRMWSSLWIYDIFLNYIDKLLLHQWNRITGHIQLKIKVDRLIDFMLKVFQFTNSTEIHFSLVLESETFWTKNTGNKVITAFSNTRFCHSLLLWKQIISEVNQNLTSDFWKRCKITVLSSLHFI